MTTGVSGSVSRTEPTVHDARTVGLFPSKIVSNPSVDETRHHHVPPIVSRLHERCGLTLDVSPLLGIWVVEMFGEIVVCIPLLLQEESLLASETPELTRCRNGMFVNVANRYDLIVQHCEEWHCARQNVFFFFWNNCVVFDESDCLGLQILRVCFI